MAITEWILVVCAVGIALLTAVTLFGNKDAQLYRTATGRLDGSAGTSTRTDTTPSDEDLSKGREDRKTDGGMPSGSSGGGSSGGGGKSSGGPSGSEAVDGGRSPIQGGREGVWPTINPFLPDTKTGNYEYEVIDSDQDGTYDKVTGGASLEKNEGKEDEGWLGYDYDWKRGYLEGEGEQHWGLPWPVVGQRDGVSGEGGAGEFDGGINLGPDQDNPWVRIELNVGAMRGSGEAHSTIGYDGRRIGVDVGASEGFDVVGGRLGVELNIPLPFTDGTVRTEAGVSTGIGEGAGGGLHSYYDTVDGRYRHGGEAGVELGPGIGIDTDMSVGRPRAEGEGAAD